MPTPHRAFPPAGFFDFGVVLWNFRKPAPVLQKPSRWPGGARGLCCATREALRRVACPGFTPGGPGTSPAPFATRRPALSPVAGSAGRCGRIPGARQTRKAGPYGASGTLQGQIEGQARETVPEAATRPQKAREGLSRGMQAAPTPENRAAARLRLAHPLPFRKGRSRPRQICSSVANHPPRPSAVPPCGGALGGGRGSLTAAR
jgi:hypothetical protein